MNKVCRKGAHGGKGQEEQSGWIWAQNGEMKVMWTGEKRKGNLPLPFKVFICCTAILKTVSLSSLRDMALHIGIIVDSSFMYVFILSRRLFSISL